MKMYGGGRKLKSVFGTEAVGLQSKRKELKLSDKVRSLNLLEEKSNLSHTGVHEESIYNFETE